MIEKKLSAIVAEMGIGCEEGVLSTLAELSEGALRDAESMLDQFSVMARPPFRWPKFMRPLALLLLIYSQPLMRHSNKTASKLPLRLLMMSSLAEGTAHTF